MCAKSQLAVDLFVSNLYVYICIYIYVYIYTYIHIYIYTDIYTEWIGFIYCRWGCNFFWKSALCSDFVYDKLIVCVVGEHELWMPVGLAGYVSSHKKNKKTQHHKTKQNSMSALFKELICHCLVSLYVTVHRVYLSLLKEFICLRRKLHMCFVLFCVVVFCFCFLWGNVARELLLNTHHTTLSLYVACVLFFFSWRKNVASDLLLNNHYTTLSVYVASCTYVFFVLCCCVLFFVSCEEM